MRKPDDIDTRTAIILQQEVDKMVACAERVRLVTQAFAQRHGLRPSRVTQDDVNDMAG